MEHRITSGHCAGNKRPKRQGIKIGNVFSPPRRNIERPTGAAYPYSNTGAGQGRAKQGRCVLFCESAEEEKKEVVKMEVIGMEMGMGVEVEDRRRRSW